ncbi:copper chaperone PCu(A)C [Corynebacterium epidermidicanis]|uniref:Copper chaperone PCu(A)C n=1 Tax=Corynebacterium epidermidicanis TaxID=1050174 RepID=A0A0G3GWS8_9CORY|nr:copper chaperone PCu(A)C [Corynebacterium epidermidicanis]AKK03292.1 hypothetical protein CEPID_07170 [Corynebacterium epidermidicanis]
MKKINSFAAVALAALSLAGCANSQKDSDIKTDTAATVAAPTASKSATAKNSQHSHGDSVAFEEGYVKAKPADKDMTGIFGTIHNGTKQPVHLVSFTTDTGAAKHEIHEVVNGVMQMKQGGVEIPAGGTYELKPGGDHLMIMDLAAPINAGDTVKVTLNFDGGVAPVVMDVPVRTIASGQENYGANGGVQGNSGMTETPVAHNHG